MAGTLPAAAILSLLAQKENNGPPVVLNLNPIARRRHAEFHSKIRGVSMLIRQAFRVSHLLLSGKVVRQGQSELCKYLTMTTSIAYNSAVPCYPLLGASRLKGID